MSDKFPSQIQDKFTVRFPDGMRDKIAEIAKKNNRSMNAEIVIALTEYISRYTVDSEIENKLNSLDIGIVSIDKGIREGALALLKQIEDQTNSYRNRLLDTFLSLADEIDINDSTSDERKK